MSDYNLLLFYKLFEVFTMLIYYIGQLANIDIYWTKISKVGRTKYYL